ncbi:Na+/H+ exchanger AnNHA1 [Coprinopsis cinerea okayama7|uniref:Na+/H+ exchanger AnNHA1 n=1 Tax=Coprinopsis cinerea (strain Okayama-7 / 130 / ATCC MYA-4618 / FGSC 9003) TaxID=240176 RepID=A8NPT3_COPC7|nr:Na+/H+ exchanger AnNHA1 [Coprinopsis cinerea okayama7\|eukprot:XP_001835395.2 Na+/H+ exchanger AnNHA1 [Coprinopsis cinerea okayama7\
MAFAMTGQLTIGNNDEVTNVVVLEFTRVVLAIGVFAIGVELPKAYMARHWKSLFFLLVPVMTWGWVVSAAFIYALIPKLNYVSSLAIAACLTPTDPILAAAVIGGKWADKHVPAHLRHLLAAESGCNDGAAFPFLFLALYLLLDIDAKTAVKDWFLLLWLYQIALAIVMGALLGFGFRHLMKFCERLDLIDRHSYVAQYVSLALFTIGVTTLLGTDDLLAAFACGTAFAWDGFFNRQTEESVFSSVIDLLFNVAAFIFVGAWMPFDKFQDGEIELSVWRLIVIAVLVLVFRRLPVMIALYRWIPDVKNLREATFSGHFGPIGIGAVFISTLALEVIHRQHPTPTTTSNYDQIHRVTEVIHPVVSFMVLCSITVHGLSIPSFSLGRRVHSVSRTWSVHSGRTWSRHATATGTARGAPEWTYHARLVSRGDAGIVINRDRGDEGAGGVGEGVGEEEEEEERRVVGVVDLEKGQTDSEKTKEGSGSEKDGIGGGERLEIYVDHAGEFDEDHRDRRGEDLESGFSGGIGIEGGAGGAPGEVRFAERATEEGGRAKLKAKADADVVSPSPPSGSPSPLSPGSPPSPPTTSISITVPGQEEEERHPHIRLLEPSYPFSPHRLSVTSPSRSVDLGDVKARRLRSGGRDDIPVIERRLGPGEDVEVTVIHDPPSPASSTHAGTAVHETINDLERTVSRELMAAAEGLHRVGSRVREVVAGPVLKRTGTSGRAERVVMRVRGRRRGSVRGSSGAGGGSGVGGGSGTGGGMGVGGGTGDGTGASGSGSGSGGGGMSMEAAGATTGSREDDEDTWESESSNEGHAHPHRGGGQGNSGSKLKSKSRSRSPTRQHSTKQGSKKMRVGSAIRSVVGGVGLGKSVVGGVGRRKGSVSYTHSRSIGGSSGTHLSPPLGSSYGSPRLASHGSPHISSHGSPHISSHGSPHISSHGSPHVSSHGSPHDSGRSSTHLSPHSSQTHLPVQDQRGSSSGERYEMEEVPSGRFRGRAPSRSIDGGGGGGGGGGGTASPIPSLMVTPAEGANGSPSSGGSDGSTGVGGGSGSSSTGGGGSTCAGGSGSTSTGGGGSAFRSSRLGVHTRDSSPARSVRFVEHGAGTGMRSAAGSRSGSRTRGLEVSPR